MLAIGIIVALGEVAAVKVHRHVVHVALQHSSSPRSNSLYRLQPQMSEIALRTTILVHSLKSFAEDTKRFVFLTIFFGFAFAAFDYFQRFPAMLVITCHVGIASTTYLLQKKVVAFICPRSPNYLHAQGSTLNPPASAPPPRPSPFATLPGWRAWCWRHKSVLSAKALIRFAVRPADAMESDQNEREKELERMRMMEISSSNSNMAVRQKNQWTKRGAAKNKVFPGEPSRSSLGFRSKQIPDEENKTEDECLSNSCTGGQ